MPRTFFSKTMPHSACKSTFSDLRYLTFTRFFDGTPRVRAPAAPRLISQLFPLFHLLPSWRQYLSSFVCESTHKIATFREDLVTADDNGTNIRGNWANYCLPVGSNQARPKNNTPRVNHPPNWIQTARLTQSHLQVTLGEAPSESDGRAGNAPEEREG